MIFNFTVFVLSFFFFLFIFWRNLKDDYIASQIFSCAFWIIILFLLGLFVSYFLKQYQFFICFFSLSIGYIIGSYRNHIKFYEGLDSFVAATLLSLAFSSLIIFNSYSFPLMIFYIFIYLIMIIYILVKRQYKSFIWYRSGKRGFSGLFCIGLFFLGRSLLSIIIPNLTLFLTEYEIFISGLISLFAFLNIFVLAGK